MSKVKKEVVVAPFIAGDLFIHKGGARFIVTGLWFKDGHPHIVEFRESGKEIINKRLVLDMKILFENGTLTGEHSVI